MFCGIKESFNSIIFSLALIKDKIFLTTLLNVIKILQNKKIDISKSVNKKALNDLTLIILFFSKRD